MTRLERRARGRPEQTAHYIKATQAIYDEWVRRQPPLTPTQRLIARELRQRLGLVPVDEPLSREDELAIEDLRLAQLQAEIDAEVDAAAAWLVERSRKRK
jgi:hypothetical protein